MVNVIIFEKKEKDFEGFFFVVEIIVRDGICIFFWVNIIYILWMYEY